MSGTIKRVESSQPTERRKKVRGTISKSVSDDLINEQPSAYTSCILVAGRAACLIGWAGQSTRPGSGRSCTDDTTNLRPTENTTKQRVRLPPIPSSGIFQAGIVFRTNFDATFFDITSFWGHRSFAEAATAFHGRPKRRLPSAFSGSKSPYHSRARLGDCDATSSLQQAIYSSW